MKSGRVSRTALNVAASMVTLGAKPGWRERLPAGLPELSEALLLSSGQAPFTPRSLALARRPAAVRFAEFGERFQPGAFEGLGRRKIFMNEQVEAALAAGATQVLVVGAGFDTLGLRLAAEYPGVSFLEVDHPATSRVKQRALQRLGQPPNLSCVAADLADTLLSTVLSAQPDWHVDARGVAVAEGLLYYLPRRGVRELFAEISASSAAGSRVAFSHLFERASYPLTRLALRVGGEPWLSASTTARLPEYIGPGWRVIEARSGRRGRDLESLAVAEKC